MLYSKVHFIERFPETYMEAYIHEPYDELKISKRKAIIVCPGGGYVGLSEREGEPIALQYFAAGLNAFILRYSCKEKAADFRPMIEAAYAIKYIREHCEELHIDPNSVFITGFSAGGHLSACAGTYWNKPVIYEALGYTEPNPICRPDATVLCYAVISSDTGNGEFQSMKNLCNGSDDFKEHAKYSVEKFVDEDTSPAFIWHTAEDSCVHVMHSLIYASELSKNKVPFELHVYPHGVHGLALCNKETWSEFDFMYEPYSEGWMELSIKWLKEEAYKKR